jgi:hypothetical protein
MYFERHELAHVTIANTQLLHKIRRNGKEDEKSIDLRVECKLSDWPHWRDLNLLEIQEISGKRLGETII